MNFILVTRTFGLVLRSILKKYSSNDSEIYNLSDIVLLLTINSLGKTDLSLCLPMAPLTIEIFVFINIEFGRFT